MCGCFLLFFFNAWFGCQQVAPAVNQVVVGTKVVGRRMNEVSSVRFAAPSGDLLHGLLLSAEPQHRPRLPIRIHLIRHIPIYCTQHFPTCIDLITRPSPSKADLISNWGTLSLNRLIVLCRFYCTRSSRTIRRPVQTSVDTK